MSTTQQNLAQQYFLENLVRLLQAWRNYLELDALKGDVFIKLGKVPDSRWIQVTRKDHWIRRIIKRCKLDRDRRIAQETKKITAYETLLDTKKVGQNPLNAYQANLLLEKFYETCSEDEQSLLRMLFCNYHKTEIAIELGISHVAARKRVERLVDKFRRFVDGGDKDPP